MMEAKMKEPFRAAKGEDNAAGSVVPPIPGDGDARGLEAVKDRRLSPEKGCGNNDEEA